MQNDRLTYFRTQAESCFQHADETSHNTTKLRWLALAEEWQSLAAEGRDEDASYPALQQIYNNQPQSLGSHRQMRRFHGSAHFFVPLPEARKRVERLRL